MIGGLLKCFQPDKISLSDVGLRVVFENGNPQKDYPVNMLSDEQVFIIRGVKFN